MANQGLRESIAELQLARARTTADPDTRYRAQAAAETLRLAEHWRTSGWNSGNWCRGDRTGRGWHDAHQPSRLL